ncbi:MULTISPECIES: hypothetical protein [unclassified Streptomyces]|nr:hypothetical protein [Streptomyces sp. SAT1]
MVDQSAVPSSTPHWQSEGWANTGYPGFPGPEKLIVRIHEDD